MCKAQLTQGSQKAAVQTYRFEFGSDSRIYSVSFKSPSIREPEIRGLLESASRASYEKCGEAIRAYLDSNHLGYSKFTVKEKPTQDRVPTKFADKLLHDPSCTAVDKWIGGTKFYYCVMDYQYWMEDCREGCYFAVVRIPSARDGQYEYHVISQTFDHTTFSREERSHFAIRKDDGEHNLITLDEEDGYPVLATFGCVDMMALLINIADVTTKQQAAELANI